MSFNGIRVTTYSYEVYRISNADKEYNKEKSRRIQKLNNFPVQLNFVVHSSEI